MGEGNNAEGVFGFELLNGGLGGLLDARQSAFAGAVFFIHRAADVKDEGEVEAHRLRCALPGGNEFDQGIAGSGVTGD